jgi:hypothetical protein
MALIIASNTPLANAVLAAPMRKLCLLYNLISCPHDIRDQFSCSVQNALDTADPSIKEKSDSEVDFRTWK